MAIRSGGEVNAGVVAWILSRRYGNRRHWSKANPLDELRSSFHVDLDSLGRDFRTARNPRRHDCPIGKRCRQVGVRFEYSHARRVSATGSQSQAPRSHSPGEKLGTIE